MNLFKSLYPMVKEELFKFGKSLKDIQTDNGYWAAQLNSLTTNPTSTAWQILLSAYLYKYCDEEERKFVNLYFFEKQSLVKVSINFPLSDRACQNWCEEILKNIIGLALEQQLASLNIEKRSGFRCEESFIIS